MLRSKAEVDRHVVKTLAKLRTDREQYFRGYSIGRLYFDIGDYHTCVLYVTRYLTVKNNNAAAHGLLGQAYYQLGRKEEALEEFKFSLELDPNQNNILLKVCELLSEENVDVDAGCIRYWTDRATVAFPRHPTLFRLCERLLRLERADSSTLTSLLRDQVAARPMDPPINAHLLRHLVQSKRFKDAFEHARSVHSSNPTRFENSSMWLDAVVETVEAYKSEVSNETASQIYNYWLLYLTALERKAYLQLGWNNTPADVTDALKSLDGALHEASHCQKLKSADLLKHFGGQLCLHGGTVLLKRALHEQNGWRRAVRSASPLLLLAYQTESSVDKNIDLRDSWSRVAAHRKSQAGHTLLACAKDKKQQLLDSISQYFGEKSWREKMYKELFGTKETSKIVNSYILNSKSFFEPKLKLPNSKIELQQADIISKKFSLNSLHLQTWIGMNFEKLQNFWSIETDELPVYVENLSHCGPETLCKFDVDAFLYCTVLIAQNNIDTDKKSDFCKMDRPKTLPAILMEPLCSAEQARWWDCVECMTRRDFDSNTNEERTLLIRGIETVRCVGNHGLDPYILTGLGKIFEQRAEFETNLKTSLYKRAALYYETALPLLEQLRNHISCNPPKKRMFSYVSRNVSNENTANSIEEVKLFLGKYMLNNNELRKAADMLMGVKSPYASFYLYQIHMKLADEQVDLQKENVTSEMRIKRFNLLSKARKFIYLTADKLKELSFDGSDHPLSNILRDHINNVDVLLSSVDLDANISKNESDAEYLSDQQSSIDENTQIISTPHKFQPSPHISNISRSAKIDMRQLKTNQFMSESVLQQISAIVESNELLRQQMQEFKNTLNDMKSQNMDVVDKKKLLTSVADIGFKVDELREENIINTMDLKKEITDLRKELEKLKISQSGTQRQDDNELLLLEETYKNNSAALSYLPRVPNANPTVPAHPYSLYPNLYSLYANQYPAVPQLFPSQLFSADHTLYSELVVPTQVQVSQPTQSAVHDYHISLPAQTQSSTPPLLLSQNTSTPNKYVNQAQQSINIPTTKPLSLFDPSKSNAEISNVPKVTALADTSTYSFMKDRPETSTVNKSRTLSERSNESYDPLPDYKPMIPLPDEVVTLTGEEGEEVIFDARAKLFRFIGGEWKERGVGQLKLLKNNSTGKIRLVMRRDTVHKICANHIITPEMELTPMTGSDKAYFWVANDFADETVKLEKLCVRFKTVEIGKQFYEAFNNSKNQTEKSVTATNTTVSSGFLTATSKVLTTKPVSSTTTIPTIQQSEQKQTSTSQNIIGGFTFAAAPTFKSVTDPTPVNTTTTTETSKPNPFASFSFAKPGILSTVATTGNLPTTIFGTPKSDVSSQNISTQSNTITSTAVFTATTTDTNKAPVVSTWGDKFKPKPGSWTCQACYINNDASSDYCVACDSPKDPGMPKKEKKPEFEGSKFTFGIPSVVSTKTDTSTTFKFGIDNQNSTPTTFSFGLPQTGLIKSPDKNDNQPIIIGSMENTKYEFAFKPKSALPKSPNKSLNESANDSNDVSQDDEGSHIFFEPVIPMPDKIDVKTGEEDEDVLYSHRSKLFRFANSEWKECGVGDVKILQHKNTKKIRVLMRREPIMKICLNHYLTSDIEYLPKDEKTWLFSACDFSTEEICPQQFCIRFINKNVANDFKNAAEKAKSMLNDPPTAATEKDEIQFVSETEVTGNEIDQARKLMLPDKFYSYKHLPTCSGCRGCDTEPDKIDPIATSDSKTFTATNGKDTFTTLVGSTEKPSVFKFDFLQNQTSIDNASTNTSTIFTNSFKPMFGITTTVPGLGMSMNFATQKQTITTPNAGNTTSIFKGFGNKGSNSPTLESLLKSTQPLTATSDVTVVSSSGTKSIFTTEVSGGTDATAKPFGFVNIFNSKKTVDDTVTGMKESDINKTVSFKPIQVNSTKDDTDDVKFVCETQVSEEDILKARKLMLPDKYFAYKDLPECPGCRGCDDSADDEKEQVVNIKNTSGVTFQLLKSDSQPKSGIFNMNFTIPKTTTTTIFGGNSTLSNITAPSLFGTAGNTLFNNTNSTANVFSSGMLFGTKSTNNTLLQSNMKIVEDTNVRKDNSELSSLYAKIVAVDDKKSQEIKTATTSSIFGQFIVPSIFSNALNKSGDNQGIDLTTYNSPFKFTTPNLNTSYKDVSDDENVPEDDGSHIFFKPAIPLPDMVEVKTGEEQEEILYTHRAKLYRFASSEWKECGVGDIKILRHLETNKLRIVMRREPVLKVCLNHILTNDIEYLVKDDKSWQFSACDFSTGEITPQQFCIRFKDKDIAKKFLEAVDDARKKYITSSDDDVKESTDIKNVENKTVEIDVPNKTDDSTNKEVLKTKSLLAPTKFTPAAEPTNLVVDEKPKTTEVVTNITTPIFGMQKQSLLFANLSSTNLTNLPVFGSNAVNMTFENIAKATDSWAAPAATEDFSSLAAKEEEKISTPKSTQFTWEGAGTPVFGAAAKNTPNSSKTDNSINEENAEEHDPQFQPIVPLPDKIEVVTGEEDENIEFNQRSKLYRFFNNEWRERGLGEFKILHHPTHGTYRMLLRQEQVHKVVLNLLITPDFKLLPMPNTSKAFIWAGLNYTDDEKGVMEKLAVRFRTEDIADKFKLKIDSILETLKITSSQNNDEIIVTDVPEDYIKARYQAEDEDATDDDEYEYDGVSYDSS